MNVAGAIVAGLAGTIVMTIVMMLGQRMGMPKMDIISMLGTMVTAGNNARPIGVVLHLMMGIVWALLYTLAWSVGIGDPTPLWGFVFGVVNAGVATGMMPLLRKIHPRPPEMARGPLALGGMQLVHAVFGLVVALVYAGFVG